MDIDKDEIAEEIQHHTEMLRVLRRRLRERELQEVKFGLNVPPEITSDLHELTERVQRHEAEIARLQTLAAEDKEPLKEIEYRALLAEAWDTGEGMPTVVSAARLAHHRLRLGITSEQSQKIESEVRTALAKEVLSMLDKVDFLLDITNRVDDLPNISELEIKKSSGDETDILSYIVKRRLRLKELLPEWISMLSPLNAAIRLNWEIVVNWIFDMADTNHVYEISAESDISMLGEMISLQHFNISEDREAYKKFFNGIAARLTAVQPLGFYPTGVDASLIQVKQTTRKYKPNNKT